MFLPFSVPRILPPSASANRVLLFTAKRTLAIVILLCSSLSGDYCQPNELSTPSSNLTITNTIENNSISTNLAKASTSTTTSQITSASTSGPSNTIYPTFSPSNTIPPTFSPSNTIPPTFSPSNIIHPKFSPSTMNPSTSSPITGHPTTISQQSTAHPTSLQDKESKPESSSSPYIALAVLGSLILCVLPVLWIRKRKKKHGTKLFRLHSAHNALWDSDQCGRESEFNVTYPDVEKRQAVARDSEGASPLFNVDDTITYAEVQFGRGTLLESGEECPAGTDPNTTYATIRFFQPPNTTDQSKLVTDTTGDNDSNNTTNNPCI